MKFETGKTYYTRSICDNDMIISITVASRTTKRIKTTEGKTLGVSIYEGIEQVRPWGRYSMAPVIGADKELKAEAPKVEQPTTLNELLAEGKDLFTPDQFTDLKNMLGSLLGGITPALVEPKPSAKIYNFADYRKK